MEMLRINPFWTGSLLMMTVGILLGGGIQLESAIADSPSEVGSLIASKPSLVDQVLTWLKGRKVRGGSRDPLVYGHAPAAIKTDSEISDTEVEVVKVWNTEPLFAWRGTAEQIEIVRQEDDELIWKAEIIEDKPWMIYSGEPLEVGETYIWKLKSKVGFFDKTHNTNPFKVMTDTEREYVKSDLGDLNEQLQTDVGKPMSSEMLAVHRSHYFKQHQLASDALRELLLIEDPSSELVPLIQFISNADSHPEAELSDD